MLSELPELWRTVLSSREELLVLFSFLIHTFQTHTQETARISDPQKLQSSKLFFCFLIKTKYSREIRNNEID